MAVPNKDGIYWYPGHRRMIPSVPWSYKIPDCEFLQYKGSEPEAIVKNEPKIFINPAPIPKKEKKVGAPINQTTLFS